MQFLEAWTETVSVRGKRTTGTAEVWFAIVEPGWHGTLPARAKRIDAPTNMVWLIGRIQTNSASDYDYVHSIQKSDLLMPLSEYPDGPRIRLIDRVSRLGRPELPPMQVAHLSRAQFSQIFAALLRRESAAS